MAPFVGEKLTSRKDNRKEATEFDILAVGGYKDVSPSKKGNLVGHVPK